MQGVFIVTAYLAYGFFVLTALHLTCTLLLVDFVTLAIATDSEHGSQRRPSSWRLVAPVSLGLLLGGLGLVECFGAVLIATQYSGAHFSVQSPEKLQTLCFDLVVFSSALNVLLVRTPRFNDL